MVLINPSGKRYNLSRLGKDHATGPQGEKSSKGVHSQHDIVIYKVYIQTHYNCVTKEKDRDLYKVKFYTGSYLSYLWLPVASGLQVGHT